MTLQISLIYLIYLVTELLTFPICYAECQYTSMCQAYVHTLDVLVLLCILSQYEPSKQVSLTSKAFKIANGQPGKQPRSLEPLSNTRPSTARCHTRNSFKYENYNWLGIFSYFNI